MLFPTFIFGLRSKRISELSTATLIIAIVTGCGERPSDVEPAIGAANGRFASVPLHNPNQPSAQGSYTYSSSATSSSPSSSNASNTSSATSSSSNASSSSSNDDTPGKSDGAEPSFGSHRIYGYWEPENNVLNRVTLIVDFGAETWIVDYNKPLFLEEDDDCYDEKDDIELKWIGSNKLDVEDKEPTENSKQWTYDPTTDQMWEGGRDDDLVESLRLPYIRVMQGTPIKDFKICN